MESYYDSWVSRMDSVFSVKEASGQRKTVADMLEQYQAGLAATLNAEEAQFAYQTGINRKTQRSSADIQTDIGVEMNQTDLYKHVLATQQELTDRQNAYAEKQAEIADLKQQIKDETDKATKKELKAEKKAAQKELKKLKLSKSQKKTLKNMNREIAAVSAVYSDSTYYDSIIDKATELRDALDTYKDLQQQIKDLKADKKSASKSEKKEINKEIKALKKEAKQYKLSKNQKTKLKTYESQIGAMELTGNYGLTKGMANTIAKQTKLQTKKDTYNDLIAQVAELNEAIKEETDKSYKKQLKKERDKLKKEAAKYKLKSSEKKTLKALNQQVDAINRLTQNSIVNNELANTAQYQLLLENIGKLQNKSKLSSKEQTKLAMYLDELDAINAGVATDKLKTYMSTYEKYWKLNNKSTLSAAEFRQLNDLTKRKEAIEQAYKDQLQALQDELQDALVAEGIEPPDLEANYNRTKDAYEKSYQAQQDYIEDSYQDTEQYKKLYSKYQKDIQDLEKGKRNGVKLTSKQKKSIKKEIDKLTEEFEALAMGATDANLADYIKTWESWYALRSKKNSGKLTKKEAKEYDKYQAKLNAWNQEKIDQLNQVDREFSDTLDKLKVDYETQVNENETKINENKANLWELAKGMAEFEIETTQAIIDQLEATVRRYEAVAHVLEETNFEALKKYGIMEIFGLDNQKDVTTLLTEQLYNAIQGSVDKVSSLANQVGLYEELLTSAETGNFADILAKYREQADEDTREIVDKIVEQLNSNDYTDNTWVAEWSQSLSDALSNILSATEEVENFKAELREKVLFAAADEAIAKSEALQSKLSAMAGIIKNEWAVDSTTGQLTQYGLAKINVMSQQLRQAQEEVANYADKIVAIQKAQQDENTAYKDEKAYLEALSDAEAQYYNQLLQVQQLSDQIVQVAKTAQQTEVDNLKKLTDARKKALQSKRAYYDYDKQIKAKTKDVEALQAQIDALNGVNTAEAKAQKTMLESQLSEAQDALEDLQITHQFDLSVQALDDFVNDLDKTLDEATKNVNKTFEEFAEKLKNLIDASADADVVGSYQTIFDVLMRNSGISVSANNLVAGAGTATSTGTSTAIVGGTTASGEYVEISQDQFLSGISSSMLTAQANITPYLTSIQSNLENIQAMMQTSITPDLSKLAQNGGTSNVTVNLNYDTLMSVAGNVDKNVVADIQKLTENIANYTKSSIYNDLRASGISITQH